MSKTNLEQSNNLDQSNNVETSTGNVDLARETPVAFMADDAAANAPLELKEADFDKIGPKAAEVLKEFGVQKLEIHRQIRLCALKQNSRPRRRSRRQGRNSLQEDPRITREQYR